jgi:mannose-6-phosphate isomerase-like protein (cupin superfamily)
MVEIHEYTGEGYKPLVDYAGWRVAVLRYHESFTELKGLERHLETDEVFVLLEGEATLITEETDGIREWKMERGKIYNVLKGVWHHIIVTPDANVLIVENRDTSAENTERRQLSNG